MNYEIFYKIANDESLEDVSEFDLEDVRDEIIVRALANFDKLYPPKVVFNLEQEAMFNLFARDVVEDAGL